MSIIQKGITAYFNTYGSNFNIKQVEMQNLFKDFADNLDNMPNCPEKSVAMRKLLESFDASMRALST